MAVDTENLRSHIAKEIIRDAKYKLTNTEPLISSGLIDSFSLVDLALHVEQTYGVKIHDHELNDLTFDNLDQLVALIESRQ